MKRKRSSMAEQRKTRARAFFSHSSNNNSCFSSNKLISSSHWLSLERFVSLLNLSFSVCTSLVLLLCGYETRAVCICYIFLYECVSLIWSVRFGYISIEFLLRTNFSFHIFLSHSRSFHSYYGNSV